MVDAVGDAIGALLDTRRAEVVALLVLVAESTDVPDLAAVGPADLAAALGDADPRALPVQARLTVQAGPARATAAVIAARVAQVSTPGIAGELALPQGVAGLGRQAGAAGAAAPIEATLLALRHAIGDAGLVLERQGARRDPEGRREGQERQEGGADRVHGPPS